MGNKLAMLEGSLNTQDLLRNVAKCMYDVYLNMYHAMRRKTSEDNNAQMKIPERHTADASSQ
jgi:hypothetical protein